jgi:hypothetical protein
MSELERRGLTDLLDITKRRFQCEVCSLVMLIGLNDTSENTELRSRKTCDRCKSPRLKIRTPEWDQLLHAPGSWK